MDRELEQLRRMIVQGGLVNPTGFKLRRREDGLFFVKSGTGRWECDATGRTFPTLQKIRRSAPMISSEHPPRAFFDPALKTWRPAATFEVVAVVELELWARSKQEILAELRAVRPRGRRRAHVVRGRASDDRGRRTVTGPGTPGGHP